MSARRHYHRRLGCPMRIRISLWNTRVWILSVVPLSGILATPPAAAQQWHVAPELEVGAQHVQNPRLDETDDSSTIDGGILNLAVALRRNTQTSSMLVRPRVEVERYSGDSNEDSEAYYIDFNGERRWQRSEWRLRGNYRQQQVLRGEGTDPEIDEEGIGDEDVTGTGRVLVRRQRDMWRLYPGASLNLTQRTALRIDLNYLNVQYDNQTIGEAIDYTSGVATAALVRRLTPDSNVQFSIFGRTYQPDDDTLSETESIGVRIRYNKKVSDVSTFFIDFGAQDAEIEAASIADEDVSATSVLWNVGYSRRFERTRWRFAVGQSVTPSGSGSMVERQLYRAIVSHQLRPRWTIDASAVFQNTNSLGVSEDSDSDERDYLEIGATLGYQLSRKWVLEGSYDYTYQDFADTSGDADRHEFLLSFVYRVPVPNR